MLWGALAQPRDVGGITQGNDLCLCLAAGGSNPETTFLTPQKMDKWLSPNHALVGFYLVSSCSECYEHLSIFYLGC